MFATDADKVNFSIRYAKAGRKYKFEIVASLISDEDMMRYDKAVSVGNYKVGAGGSLVPLADLDVSGLEAELFEKYVQTINGRPLAEVLSKIPPQLKSALFQRGFSDVWVEEEREKAATEYSVEDIANNAVTIQAAFNGEIVILGHEFAEPTAEDALAYKRIVKMKTLAGRRRMEYAISANCSTYASLYDRLIQRVSGYSFAGESLLDVGSKKNLIPYMHKKVAIRALFGVTTEEEDEDQGQ